MKFSYLMCSLLAVSVLGGCSKPVEESEKISTQVEGQEAETTSLKEEYVANPEWETLKVGSETSYEPFEFKNEAGLPVGFEIDLIREIGKVEEFNVDVFDHSRKDIVNSFNTHGFSIWAAALSDDPKRAETMDLSDKIITTEMNAFVLDNESNQSITTISDLKNKKFAISKGASQSTLEKIEKLAGSKDSTVMADSFFLALSSVYNGKSDVILADKTVAAYYLQQFPEYKLKGISIGKDSIDIAFAVKKGDTETLEKINNGLSKLKENGTHQKLLEKWFGDNL